MGTLLGTYAGTVEGVDAEPKRLGRLKVRVPLVYGPGGMKENSLTTAQLPWASPSGLPAGGTEESGAILWLPNVGDHVHVRFLDGEPEKPIWEWGWQDENQAEEFPYWREIGYTPAGGAPVVAALIRHRHSVQLSPEGIMLRTGKGYKLRFNDETGQLDIYSPISKQLIGALTVSGDTVQFQPGESFSVATKTFVASADNVEVDSMETIVTAILAAAVRAPNIKLGPTDDANDPVVRLSDLKAVVDKLTQVYNAHFHKGVTPGGGVTATPLVPLQITPSASAVTFTA